MLIIRVKNMYVKKICFKLKRLSLKTPKKNVKKTGFFEGILRKV